jgi:hypothetical protein
MTSRKRPSSPRSECLEREPRDPLVWLGRFAAAHHCGDTAACRELHRQLVTIGYAVVHAEAALPSGALLATLTLADGAAYRLVQLEPPEIYRLLGEMAPPRSRSTP